MEKLSRTEEQLWRDYMLHDPLFPRPAVMFIVGEKVVTLGIEPRIVAPSTRCITDYATSPLR